MQVLNDVKARMASLMADGTQLQLAITAKQKELDGFEADFQRTSTQSAAVAAGFKQLQAQIKGV